MTSDSGESGNLQSTALRLSCGSAMQDQPSAPFPTGASTIHELADLARTDDLDQLSEVLIDCVKGGASVSFMQPMTREKADRFWRGVEAGVKCGERVLLVARDQTNEIVGTVQIVLSQPENQPHRADIAKMLVHRRARRRGIAEALMRTVEAVARREDKILLVLDTVTAGDAERLYTRLGWINCGMIPDYALFPSGGLAATTIFYKKLEPHA